jgi:hypothetical protein
MEKVQMKPLMNWKEMAVIALFLACVGISFFSGMPPIFLVRWIVAGYLLGMFFEVCTADAWNYDVRGGFFVTLGDISFIVPLGWAGIIITCETIERWIYPMLTIDNYWKRIVASHLIAFSAGGLFEIFLFKVVKLWKYNWDHWLLKSSNVINGKRLQLFGVPFTIIFGGYQLLIGIPCLVLAKLFGWR